MKDENESERDFRLPFPTLFCIHTQAIVCILVCNQQLMERLYLFWLFLLISFVIVVIVAAATVVVPNGLFVLLIVLSNELRPNEEDTEEGRHLGTYCTRTRPHCC